MLENEIQQGEDKGAINVLAKALNGKDLKDGIGYISTFNSKLVEAINRTPKEIQTKSKSETINQADLLAGIQHDMMKDMEDER